MTEVLKRQCSKSKKGYNQVTNPCTPKNNNNDDDDNNQQQHRRRRRRQINKYRNKNHNNK